MANTVIMPRQGQSVESCIITTWHKKKGDAVKEGDIIFSYETDKSAFDEPSQFSGTILATLAEEGDVVDCLSPVCIIGEEGEDISSLLNSAPDENKAGESDKNEPVKIIEEKNEIKADITKPETDNGRIKISPRAKNLAIKTGADMSFVVPTGPHGRIIERDINAALDTGKIGTTDKVLDYLSGKITVQNKTDETNLVPLNENKVSDAPAYNLCEYTEIPLNNVRRVIARTMHQSLSEMAQLTLNSSFDATSLLAYRASLKEKGEALGLSRITINDMILFAVSRVLPNFAEINANLIDDKFRMFSHANIGMATDTDRGLLVPVIFGAELMSLSEISYKAKYLAARAKEGTLSPDDMSGGSFTVTNLGSLGIESFTPVINPPQTAILGVCCAVNRTRADGSIYPAMGLSLTFDHRAVDGAPAAKFLRELCTALENFNLLLAK